MNRKIHEFALTDIFTVQGSKTTPKAELNLSNSGIYPYVTTSAVKNGVYGYCDAYTEKGGVITIDSAVLGTAFYQERNFVASDHVEKLIPKFNMTSKIALYLVSILNKTGVAYGYSYAKKRSQKALKKEFISLPVIESSDPSHIYTPDDIDWTYMDEHIRRLEEEHIRRLEKYLKVTGFESTILTPEEQEVLRKFRTGGVIFRNYRICDLFELLPQSYRASKLDFRENGIVPAYSSDTRNNGCIGYVNHAPEFAISENTPVYLVFGDHTKTRNIVHQSFVGMDNIKVLRPKEKLTDEQLLYISSAWGKAIPSLGYARHWSVAKKALFLLPSTPSGEPDYDLMSTYIRALEKKTVQKLKEKYLTEEKATRKIAENGN